MLPQSQRMLPQSERMLPQSKLMLPQSQLITSKLAPSEKASFRLENFFFRRQVSEMIVFQMKTDVPI